MSKAKKYFGSIKDALAPIADRAAGAAPDAKANRGRSRRREREEAPGTSTGRTDEPISVKDQYTVTRPVNTTGRVGRHDDARFHHERFKRKSPRCKRG